MATIWADGLVLPTPTLVSGDNWRVDVTAPDITLVSGTNDSVLTIPIITMSSNDGNVARLTAPAITLSADEGFEAVLTAPVPTLSSDEGFESILTAPVPTLVFDDFPYALLTAPTPTLDAHWGAAAALTAPAPTLVATIPPALSAELFIPAPTLTSEGLSGEVATVEASAPAPTIFIGTADIVLSAPVPVLATTGLSGGLLVVEAIAAAPVLSAYINNPTIITAANTATLPQLSAALASGNIATAALAARLPTLTADALTGTVASLLATAATPTMEAAGHPAYTITFAGIAPVPYLDAVLGFTPADNYRTWCLNLRKLPLTEYDNFNFNSYAVFNGKVIAAGATGLVELGAQSTDAGTAIAATVTLGQESFGTSLHKRIPRIYLGYKTDGDMHFSTITTEGGTRTYALPWNYVTGVQQRRIGVGKGPRSRFWSFSIANVDGADFSINDILAHVTLLRRRVM